MSITFAGRDPAVLAAVVDLEIDDRIAALGFARDRFGRTRLDLTGPTGNLLVVADTNIYLNRPDENESFDALPWADLVEDYTRPILLLVPMVVVDEFDKLKRSRDQRGRARRAGRWLAEIFDNPQDTVLLQPPSIRAAGVSCRLVLDDLDHERLPTNDAELIDVAATIQSVAGREVHLVTSDTGMALRARATSLTVHLLPDNSPAPPATNTRPPSREAPGKTDTSYRGQTSRGDSGDGGRAS